MSKAPPFSCRVLFVSHAAVLWGAEQALLRLAPALRERRVEPLLASPAEGSLADAWQAKGFEHVPLRLPPHGGIRGAGDNGRRPGPGELSREAVVVGRWVAALVRAAGRADILHSNSLWAHPEVVMAAKAARRPAVLQLHDFVRPGAGRRLLAMSTRTADATIAITRAVADAVGPGAGNRFEVIGYGLDPAEYHPGPPDPEVRELLGGGPPTPLVGILGRIDPEKGTAVVVRAIRLLKERGLDVRLAVVGAAHRTQSGYEKVVRQEASDLGDLVRFVPPQPNVPAVLRSLDVLVNASTAEPFGLTILEAQACGTPVVATASGGVPEFVRDGATGLLVPVGDERALADALQRLLSDPPLRENLVANALDQVARDRHISVQADRTVALYRRLVR